MLTPERISPPLARCAPVSRLPVWQLWMPPIRASWLYSPRRNSSFSRNGMQRLEHLAQFHLSPSPLAHHSLLWNPLPENRQANRTGGSDERSFGLLVAPDRQRLQPRQRHRHADAAQEGPPRQGIEDGFVGMFVRSVEL